MNKISKFFINNWLTILLAFIPPILITYYLERDVYQFDVALKSNTAVIQIEKQYSDGISVFYHTNRIEALNALEFTVKNSGNRPIEDSHFKKPLTFIFNGSVLPNPRLVSVQPKDLSPILKQTATNELVLSPLLLNEGDHFSFLAYLVDSKTPYSPVSISARITNIKEPRLHIEAPCPSKNPTKAQALSLILGIVGSLVSIFSIITLGKRFKEVTLEISPLYRTGFRNLHAHEASFPIQRLAQELGIGGQDYKSNLLLIRIKIEEQLRELANRVEIPSHIKQRSPIYLTRHLGERGVLPGKVVDELLNVLPLINRELHTSNSYLEDSEYENLRRLALLLVGMLMGLNGQKGSLVAGISIAANALATKDANDIADAIENLELVQRIYTDDKTVALYLARLYREHGEYEKATNVLREFISASKHSEQLDSGHDIAYYNIACYLALKAKHDESNGLAGKEDIMKLKNEAISNLTTAIEHNPELITSAKQDPDLECIWGDISTFNKNHSEQAGPGYPPQSVGSPDP